MQWIAIDNTNATISESAYPIEKGLRSPWVRFCDDLEQDGRYLTGLGIMTGERELWLPPNAEFYDLHYESSSVIGDKKIETQFYTIISSYSDNRTTSCKVDEEGNVFISLRTGPVKSMAPTPRRENE